MNDKFIKYYKYIKEAKEIIESRNLNKKDVLRVNNLYMKADKLLLKINKKKSYSTASIAGSIAAVALMGGFLYYFGRRSYILKTETLLMESLQHLPKEEDIVQYKQYDNFLNDIIEHNHPIPIYRDLVSNIIKNVKNKDHAKELLVKLHEYKNTRRKYIKNNPNSGITLYYQ